MQLLGLPSYARETLRAQPALECGREAAAFSASRIYGSDTFRGRKRR